MIANSTIVLKICPHCLARYFIETKGKCPNCKRRIKPSPSPRRKQNPQLKLKRLSGVLIALLEIAGLFLVLSWPLIIIFWGAP